MSPEEFQREVLARLARIEKLLECRQPGRSDEALMSKLLPAIAGKIGSDEFTTREVLRRIAIAEIAGMGTHKLGMLFARCVGMSIDGLAIERISKPKASAVLWRCVAKPSSPHRIVARAASRLP